MSRVHKASMRGQLTVGGSSREAAEASSNVLGFCWTCRGHACLWSLALPQKSILPFSPPFLPFSLLPLFLWCSVVSGALMDPSISDEPSLKWSHQRGSFLASGPEPKLRPEFVSKALGRKHRQPGLHSVPETGHPGRSRLILTACAKHWTDRQIGR